MKKLFLIIFILLHSGCSDKPRNVSVSRGENDLGGLDEICSRISSLNMTVVTPGGGVNDEQRLDLIKIMRKYKINIPRSSLVNENILGGADTDARRAERFLKAASSDYGIIWAMRGGHGSYRLIKNLKQISSPKNRKTFIGFSDITAMNLFISQKWKNWRVIHGAMLSHLSNDLFYKNKFSTLLDILENKINSYDIKGVYPLNPKAKSMTTITGKLTGGNISIIEAGLKTCWEIETNGKILFLEDVNENYNRIYRYMYHLQEAGKLSGVKAIIFGHFQNCSDQNKITLCLKEFSKTLKIPVYITDQFGHGKYNMPLIYNATAKIHDNKLTVFLKKN